MPASMLYAPPSPSRIEHSQQTRLQSALLCQWAREQRAVSAYLQALSRALMAWGRIAAQRHKTLVCHRLLYARI